LARGDGGGDNTLKTSRKEGGSSKSRAARGEKKGGVWGAQCLAVPQTLRGMPKRKAASEESPTLGRRKRLQGGGAPKGPGGLRNIYLTTNKENGG